MKNLYLGIDASKGYADFLIINESHDVVEDNFQLDDCFEGHKKLYEILNSHLKTDECCIFAGIESTGGYENNWYELLCRFKEVLDLKVVRLNPLGVHYHSKASLNRLTTDKISARNIASYLISQKHSIRYDNTSYFGPARKQWKFTRLLKKQRVQILNQLESLLYSSNPEILTYCKDCTPQYVLRVLEKYPTAKKLSRAKIRSLSSIPYVSEEKAEAMVQSARASVASDNSKEMEFLISSIVKQIINLDRTIRIQEKTLFKLADNKDVELLKSVPGINDYGAVGMILEIGNIERFESLKSLSSFFGLHPVFKESGDKIGGMRMSKQGRKEPRHILFMAALTAIRDDEMIIEQYNKYLENGKAKMAAIGIVMHKLLRIIYGILKNRIPYNPEIDRKNREKNLCRNIREDKKKETSSRRFQSYASKAPISTKQAKKRKQQETSQNDSIIKCGISAPAVE